MNTITSSYKISQGFCVNEYELKDTDVKDEVKVREPINHVFCCDISGSMWRSLPKMREQLKNRLSSIVEENDTISIIVFADPEDCVVVKEHVHCNNARELSELHKAIDRFLVDQGCTDFYTPLELTRKLIRPKERYNFVFLSDGYHNCCSYDKVIDSLNKLAPEIAQCTVIEYGYNADSDRLSQMAEILGGSKIPSADFDEYVPIMENVFKGGAVAPKVKVFVTADVKNLIKPIVIFMNEGTSQVTSVVVEDDGYALLPTSVKKFWTVTRKNSAATISQKPIDIDGFYAVAYILADKLEYDLVEDLLYYIGDKKFISQYQSSFGKQKLFVFQNDIAAAVFDKTLRGEIDPSYKASDDRYCVIDFFNELSTNEDNLVRVASEDFNYNRIGAKSVDKVVLTDEEKKALAEAKSTAAAEAILNKAKERQVKMTKIDKGYPLDSFVWNEDRANLGGLFNIEVELELPENKFGLTKVNSTIFRNYTIIKDGIVNIPVLPLIITKDTLNAIKKHDGVVVTIQKELDNGMTQCLVDISALPVINKKKIKGAKKAEMTKLALNLTDSKFCLKYLKSLVTKAAPAPLSDGYTPEQADYLASLGITSKGYNPPKEAVKDGDFYMAPTINSAFKGFSSEPKISDVLDKVKGGKKLTPSVEYMAAVIKRVDEYLAKNSTDANREEVISQMIADMEADKKNFARQLAQMKFAMLVSRKWFEGSTNFDDNTDTIHSQYGLDMLIEYRFVDKKQNL
jgi:hypothetical protein